MKILLLNVQKPIPSYVTSYDPLGLAYLAAYAQRHLTDVEFRIATISDADALPADGCDAIGISSVTQNFGLTLKIIRRLSDSGLPLLLGGVHITLLPSSLPRGKQLVGVLGEGEQTFVELIRLLQRQGRFSPEALSAIPGIAFRNAAGDLTVTAQRPPLSPLDQLPFPERGLLDIPRGGTAYLFSSRGCPFKCVFCASTRLFDRLRLFSAEYVVAEIRHMVHHYQPTHLKFYDDLFIASKSRLREISGLLTAEKLTRKLLFSINAAASMIDEETARLLRRMNVYSVGMGLESGNQAVLDFLKAGKASVEKNLMAVEVLAKHGINPSASFIVGSPHEDESAFEDTLRFLSRSKLSNSYLYLLTPYPGTPLWDYAKERGLVSDDMDWDRLDINDNTDFTNRIILCENLSPEILRKQFRKFRSVSRRKYVQRLVAQGIKRPDLILPFFKLHLVRR